MLNKGIEFARHWDDTRIGNGSILTVGPFTAQVFWYESKCHVEVMGNLLDLIYYNTDLAKLAAEQELMKMFKMGIRALTK